MRCDRVPETCEACPLGRPAGKVGLIWVGEEFYKTPADFLWEAARQGVSRRVSSVPKGFALGHTLVAVAHRKAMTVPCLECMHQDQFRLVREDEELCPCGGTGIRYQAAIFHVFMPQAIEYVVKGDETEEELDALVKRGITPVKVIRSPKGHSEQVRK